MNEYTLTITADQHHHRLDRALTALLVDHAVSRARLQALMAGGHLTLNGKAVSDASRKAKAGEVYTLHLPLPEAAKPAAQKIALTILYEDDDLLVIDKPAGMVVHPAPGNRDRTLVNALLAHCGDSLSGIGGVARPGIVHRLDKDTSGLMVVAKHDAAHRALSAQFADRTLSRTYRAVVWGEPVPRSGQIEAPIGRHPTDRKRMAVTARGRYALTHYKVLKIYTGFALVECKLSTGRTHQIRVHLAHLKHPVVGDPVYAARKPKGSKVKGALVFLRQALHAAELRFVHPKTGKAVTFKSELPADMRELLKLLKVD